MQLKVDPSVLRCLDVNIEVHRFEKQYLVLVDGLQIQPLEDNYAKSLFTMDTSSHTFDASSRLVDSSGRQFDLVTCAPDMLM